MNGSDPRARGVGARRRPRVRGVVLAAVSLVLGLVGLEWLARHTTGPVAFFDGMVFDADLGFRRPGGVELWNADEIGPFPFRLNAEGHRSPPLPAEPRVVGGPRRVVFLGDSFLAAWGVRAEARLPERLAARWQEEGRGLEWYALGCDGYGLAQQLVLLEQHGAHLAPDDVVLLCYPANDVANGSLDLAERTTVSPGDRLRPYLVRGADGRATTRRMGPLLHTLRANSQVVRLVERAWLQRQRRLSRPPFAERESPWVRLADGRAPREDLELFREHPADAVWSRAWADFVWQLEEFQTRVRRLGARPLVVVVPSRSQVILDAFDAEADLGARLLGLRGLWERLDADLPERRLAALFGRLELDAVFLLDELRRDVRPGEPLCYLADGHLSARGHNIAARLLAEALGEQPGTVPPAAPAVAGPISPLPPPAAAPRVLDLRSAPPPGFLADGFRDWLPAEGLEQGPSARLVMPPVGGELVVRGVVPDALPLPSRGHVSVSWLAEDWFEIETAGPFEWRLPVAIPPAARALDPLPYLTVRVGALHSYQRPGDGRTQSLLLQSVGWR